MLATEGLSARKQDVVEENIMVGVVDAIYLAAKGGEPMLKVDEGWAVADGGLEGDRYMTRTGYWTNIDECQVTLIEGEILDKIVSDSGVKVGDGEHRRNIVTRGIQLQTVVGRQFSVGGAVMVYDRPRPPCGYIQTITERGMTKALAGMRGGICARVLESGVIKPTDCVSLLEDV
ncbi:MAG: MOSC domain-containing protein [Candidatus Latescibacterota bacterium]|nr:MOSC domain-containing protein [Candidatus Latescibacterota bacterium]